jgi:hypothetical protein|tara:strand:+ start:178 stop:474 length:297 start_codon:yes stop_codon:yes gene_type:complete
MVRSIVVNDAEAFEQRIKDKDLSISKGIVEGILKNLTTKKNHIHVLEVHLLEDDQIIDITCHRDDFIETLEQNLETHLYHEDYEGCSGIQKAIEFLKK